MIQTSQRLLVVGPQAPTQSSITHAGYGSSSDRLEEISHFSADTDSIASERPPSRLRALRAAQRIFARSASSLGSNSQQTKSGASSLRPPSHPDMPQHSYWSSDSESRNSSRLSNRHHEATSQEAVNSPASAPSALLTLERRTQDIERTWAQLSQGTRDTQRDFHPFESESSWFRSSTRPTVPTHLSNEQDGAPFALVEPTSTTTGLGIFMPSPNRSSHRKMTMLAWMDPCSIEQLSQSNFSSLENTPESADTSVSLAFFEEMLGRFTRLEKHNMAEVISRIWERNDMSLIPREAVPEAVGQTSEGAKVQPQAEQNACFVPEVFQSPLRQQKSEAALKTRKSFSNLMRRAKTHQ